MNRGEDVVKVEYGIDYQEGKIYTLVVDGIKSKDGQKLQKTTMNFRADLLTEEELEEREKEEQEKLDKIIDYAFSAMDIERAKSDAAKAEMISTWLTTWLLYDGNAINDGTLTDYQRTALGALETRRTVCEGYARAFKAIAERAGLEAKYVLGWGQFGG
ncbi:MAG: transglutaminase-like domain-containing protein, partial [Alphaproteobacteria bacterium]|nr:transglutaminase-like domain-containing protein [Alphaproteobacteria bacterium]